MPCHFLECLAILASAAAAEANNCAAGDAFDTLRPIGDAFMQKAWKRRDKNLASAPAASTKEAKSGGQDVYILTVPNVTANQERFAHCARIVEELGYAPANPIEGINYHRFYPSNAEALAQGWSPDQIKFEKQKAARAIFQEYRKLYNLTVALPAGFEEDAIGHLFPGQIAVYLGHLGFWEKAAQQPEGSSSVILEDDAELLANPEQLKAAIEQGSGANDILNLACQGQFGMANTMGYVVSPTTAQQLIQGADGKIPVDWAINKLHAAGAISGHCNSLPLLGKGFGAETSTKQLLETAKPSAAT
mmetsp:Transcript_30507/g.66546  ORF Transcript_30507/g.66546 Transcript_30507/m.66546 type:complete len:304 (-) Transcript_30507:202-1113(-)